MTEVETKSVTGGTEKTDIEEMTAEEDMTGHRCRDQQEPAHRCGIPLLQKYGRKCSPSVLAECLDLNGS